MREFETYINYINSRLLRNVYTRKQIVYISKWCCSASDHEGAVNSHHPLVVLASTKH